MSYRVLKIVYMATICAVVAIANKACVNLPSKNGKFWKMMYCVVVYALSLFCLCSFSMEYKKLSYHKERVHLTSLYQDALETSHRRAVSFRVTVRIGLRLWL